MENNNKDSIEKRAIAIRKMFHIHRDLFKLFFSAIENKSVLETGEGVNFSKTEIMILLLLKHKNYKATELAKEIGISASTLTGVIDRLAKKGYVERKNDENDRRVVILCGGTKLKEGIKVAYNKIIDDMVNLDSSLDDDWWDDLSNKLSILSTILKEKLDNLDM